MSDQLGRRFDPGELGGPDGPRLSDAELADDLAVARDLELFARAEQPMPSVGFEDRVMAALATEPPPRGVLAGSGRRSLVAMLADAWRVAMTPGRPMALRAQALAMVLVAAVAVSTLGSAAVVGVASLLAPDGSPTPTPSEVPTASPPPSSEPSRTPILPSPSTGPSPSLEPSSSPSPSEDASPEPTETPEATQGSGASPRTTPRPTATDDDDAETPEPAETLKPGETPDPDD